MKRTDKLARDPNHAAYYKNGVPVTFLASFDVTEDVQTLAAKSGFRVPKHEQHLCFTREPDGVPSVTIAELYSADSSMRFALIPVEEVLTDVLHDVFDQAQTVSLRFHGLTVDGYRALVKEAWELFAPELEETRETGA